MEEAPALFLTIRWCSGTVIPCFLHWADSCVHCLPLRVLSCLHHALEQVHGLSWRGVQLLWKHVLTLFSFSHVIKVFLFTHNKWFVLASFLVCDHTLLSILVLCEGLFNDFYVFVPSLLQTLCLTGKQWQTAGFFSAPLRVGKASHSRYGPGNSMKFGKKQKWTVCKLSRVRSSPSRCQKWSVRVWHLRRDCFLQR